MSTQITPHEEITALWQRVDELLASSTDDEAREALWSAREALALAADLTDSEAGL